LASDAPLSRDKIVALVTEVADELPVREPRQTIIVVGGSLLAWHGLRDTTADVDSIRRLDAELQQAVARVAERHDLAASWLNDSAAAYWPQTLDESACEELLDHQSLLVLGAPYRAVFLMKLFAARATDHDDLVRLWRLCSFQTPQQAVTDMYEAFPAAPEDPHLVDYVAEIARESEART
jgi:hypothetical protein